jgi:hypothetical protein
VGDRCFGKDDEFEDSDCEGGVDLAVHGATETGIEGGEESEQGTLSVLSIGSSSR